MNTSTPYLVNEDENSETNTLELPNNIEAEQQLLGALIRNNDLIEKCNNTRLSGEHFYNKLHGKIYEKINKSLSTGKTANIIFLKTFFENDEEFDSDQYFEQLVINAAPGPAIEEYSSLIYDLALRRELINTAEFLQHSSFDLGQEDVTANDIIEETENKLFQIEVSGDAEQGFESFEKTLTESLTTIESAYQSSGGLAGLSTGVKDLDKALGGLQKSDLIILAGRPAMGKTSLANNIGFNVAKKFSETLQNDEVKTDRNGNIIYSHDDYLNLVDTKEVTAFPWLDTMEMNIKKPYFLIEPEFKEDNVIDERIAFLVKDTLQEFMTRGTAGRKASVLGRKDIGGKTGTTNDAVSTWFSGFHEDLVTTVWVGTDDFTSLGENEYGSTIALPIWLDFMQDALKNLEVKEKIIPKGISFVKVNKKTGVIDNSLDSETYFELILDENLED